MEETFKKENIPIKVQFEYLNDNDILELSSEETINISLLENTDFGSNKEKIISNSKFKTQKERSYYHMFNKSNKKFLTKNSDFIPYIKTKTTIILINCYIYAKNEVEKIKKELYNTCFSLNMDLKQFELKKKEIEILLSCLENNLQIDIFAEEFIYKNGIDYLVTIIKNNNGNIRKYALESIKKLLSFQNTFNYFEENNKLLSTLYDVFIGNNENNCVYCFFDIIVELIGGNEEKVMNLIEKIDDNFYNKLVNYLSDNNIDINIKSHTLLFINMILNFSSSNKHMDLLVGLTKAKIFDNLNKIINIKENTFLEQLNLFENSIQKILNESNKENNDYKNIKQLYNIYIDNKKVYNIQNLIRDTQNEDQKIKKDAIDELNKLLKDNNYMYILYESFMKNDNLAIVNLFYDYIIKQIESKEDKIIVFINAAKRYSEKTNTKVFSQIIKNLSKRNKYDIKSQTLLFINAMLSFTYENKQSEILLYCIEAGIFDILNKAIEISENFEKQLKIFNNLIEQMLEKSDETEEQNFNKIKKKCEIYITEKKYEIIRNLILEDSYEELINLMKGKGYNEILYNEFMDNKNKKLDYKFLDIFLQLYGKNEETMMNFVNIAQKYADENKSKIFTKIINYTSEENLDYLLKSNAIKTINIILINVKPDMQCKLLIQFGIIGLFKNINFIIKNNTDVVIKLQIDILFNTIKNIIKNIDKNDKDYVDINKIFKTVEENKKFHDKIDDDFVIV